MEKLDFYPSISMIYMYPQHVFLSPPESTEPHVCICEHQQDYSFWWKLILFLCPAIAFLSLFFYRLCKKHRYVPINTHKSFFIYLKAYCPTKHIYIYILLFFFSFCSNSNDQNRHLLRQTNNQVIN